MAQITPGDSITPTDGGVPEIPVVNFTDQAKQQAQGLMEAGTWSDLWGNFWGSILPGSTSVLSFTVGIVDKVMTVVAKIFTAFQGTNEPGFFEMVAAIIEDLLGVPVSSADIQGAFARGGNIAGVKAIGGKLWDQLVLEFGQGNTLTPEGGLGAAKAFIGFLMAFAVRQGNVAFISEILPEQVDFIKGVREYGELMAKNLGLGRMARRALQPLIQTLIADPLQWFLNKTYKPTLLNPGQAVKAFNLGYFTEADLLQELAYAGYNDQRAKLVRAEGVSHLSADVIERLNRYGLFKESDAIFGIQLGGYNSADAEFQLASQRFADVDTEVSAYLSLLRKQRASNFIDAPTFASQLDTLPLSQQHKDFIRILVGQELSYPRVDLSLAEVQTAFVHGILDLEDVQKYLAEHGYSNEDALTLQYLTLIKLDTLEARKQVALFGWNKAKAKAAAKGLPEPPMPAILAQ